MSTLSRAQIRRAKDLAAVASSQAYMETLQIELRAMFVKGKEPPTLIAVAGVHVHEAVVVDESGNALALRCIWEILSSPEEVAGIMERARNGVVS